MADWLHNTGRESVNGWFHEAVKVSARLEEGERLSKQVSVQQRALPNEVLLGKVAQLTPGRDTWKTECDDAVMF